MLRSVKGEEMFIEERHKEILAILSRDGRIKAREIEELFGVGFDTARRDLRLLEDKGLLKRTHGGAIPMLQVGFKAPKTYTPRDIVDIKSNYMAIALEAVTHIKKNDVVYITGASVGYFMVQNLPRNFEFTVATNSIIIADELRKYDNITTFIIGGVMTHKGHIRNHFSILMIESMRFDLSFLTAAAYSADFGMSIQSSDSVSVFHAVMNSSRKIIGLFPNEKMGRNAMLKICPPEAIHTVITDGDTRQEEIHALKELNIEVIIAKEN